MKSRKSYNIYSKKKYRINYVNILMFIFIVAIVVFGISKLSKSIPVVKEEKKPDEIRYIELIDFTEMQPNEVQNWCQEKVVTCDIEFVYDSSIEYNSFISHDQSLTTVDADDGIHFEFSLGEEALISKIPYDEVDVIENPSALDVLVDKNNMLPFDYVPEGLRLPDTLVSQNDRFLRDDCASAFELLYQAALGEGYKIGVASAYRSYDLQYTLYSNYSAAKGSEKADTFSARPGHSEHQTGLTLDWYTPTNLECYLSRCLEDSEEYQWMGSNMHIYGFTLSYPKDNSAGYMFEPWHIRYVGINLANYLHENNLTIDKYYKSGKIMHKALK